MQSRWCCQLIYRMQSRYVTVCKKLACWYEIIKLVESAVVCLHGRSGLIHHHARYHTVQWNPSVGRQCTGRDVELVKLEPHRIIIICTKTTDSERVGTHCEIWTWCRCTTCMTNIASTEHNQEVTPTSIPATLGDDGIVLNEMIISSRYVPNPIRTVCSQLPRKILWEQYWFHTHRRFVHLQTNWLMDSSQ